MESSAERIKAILQQSPEQPTKPALTDEQVEQKAQDMRAFFDRLTVQVEQEVNGFIDTLEEGSTPSVEEMDDTIRSFNHIVTINDAHNTYIPRHDVKGDLEVIRLYVETNYSQETLERLDKAISGESVKATKELSA